jgi:5'-nucleotidase/UDP-sugar diphosphatase
MKSTQLTLLLIFSALMVVACGQPAVTASPSLTSGSSPTPTPLSGRSTTSAPVVAATQLTILYTDDEHGWMSGQENGQGAAELSGIWQADYNLGQDPSVIALSGGDNWTGPAISTWFDGDGMVAVMNQMGYTASAIGNHEFDFGLEVLQTRLEQADFPYLSANIRLRSDGSIPSGLGIQPYTLLDVAGVRVGIIGLSATYTPMVANPAFFADFEFIPYETALREYIPQMRSAGAEIILLIAHACPDELELLASQVRDLGISMMGGGHCHLPYARSSGDTAILTSDPNLGGFAYVTLAYDATTQQTSIENLGVESNQGGQPDPAVALIVSDWQARTDAELDVEIGYLSEGIPQDSQAMQDLITESWLWSYPNADIALTNLGGIRDQLPAGSLTIAEIISVMPFNNTLVELNLTGAQVISVLATGRGGLAIGGIHRQGSSWALDNTDIQLAEDLVYSVLVNDYMYAGGDGYTLLAEADPAAYQTGIDWRQPVLEWILAQSSTPANSLDVAIVGLKD